MCVRHTLFELNTDAVVSAKGKLTKGVMKGNRYMALGIKSGKSNVTTKVVHRYKSQPSYFGYCVTLCKTFIFMFCNLGIYVWCT